MVEETLQGSQDNGDILEQGLYAGPLDAKSSKDGLKELYKALQDCEDRLDQGLYAGPSVAKSNSGDRLDQGLYAGPPVAMSSKNGWRNFTRLFKTMGIDWIKTDADRLRDRPLAKMAIYLASVSAMSSFEQKANIKFCVKLKKSFTETLVLMNEAYEDEILSRTQVYFWYKRYKNGRKSIGDDSRSGRPLTSTTDRNIGQVHDLIVADRKITINNIS
ncbi:hypothetical protein LAZ67_2006116 [Cordylochernes scorpioides]|uniref:Mos1 transposase HTH domain-containing protein n=1 Tax=Cordylochernes scorpioides TaxID=51811 RepID=A0ABY6K513_9ARAC|nr:hypothetical protein LAZ67_2006116 [Cordylochernes scorpioides]